MSQIRTLIHHNGKIRKKRGEGFVFISDKKGFAYLDPECGLNDLRREIHNSLDLENSERILKIIYRMPVSSGSMIQYYGFQIRSDSDVRIMVDCHSTFPEVRILELFVETIAVSRDGNNEGDAGPSERRNVHVARESDQRFDTAREGRSSLEKEIRL